MRCQFLKRYSDWVLGPDRTHENSNKSCLKISIRCCTLFIPYASAHLARYLFTWLNPKGTTEKRVESQIFSTNITSSSHSRTLEQRTPSTHEIMKEEPVYVEPIKIYERLILSLKESYLKTIEYAAGSDRKAKAMFEEDLERELRTIQEGISSAPNVELYLEQEALRLREMEETLCYVMDKLPPSKKGKDFYIGNLNFENRSNKMCYYNSWLICMIHERFYDYFLLRTLPFDEDEVKELTSKADQSRNELSKMLSTYECTLRDLTDKYGLLAENIKKIREEILEKEERLRDIDKILYITDKPGWRKRAEEFLLVKRKELEIDEKSCAEIEKQMGEIRKQIGEIQNKISIVSQGLENRLQKHEQEFVKLKAMQKKWREAFNEMRTTNVNNPLLNRKERVEDDVYDFWKKLVPRRYRMHEVGAQDLKNNPERLRQYLIDSDWRAIKTGGGGHAWAYLKKEDGTIFRVDDLRNPLKAFNNTEEMFKKWSNPRVWAEEDLCFFEHGRELYD